MAIDPDVVLAGGGEMGAAMRATDWSRTQLGPVASWPSTLRSIVGMALGNAFPMCVWWGPDLLCLYNDGYRPILGDKHPRALGAPGREVWSDIWPIVGPLAEGILAGGPAIWNEHLLLPMMRKGWLEETYFTFSYSPLRGEAGNVDGILITCQETTSEVQAARQLDTLRELGTRLAPVRTEAEVTRVAAEVLERNDADLPSVRIALDRSPVEPSVVPGGSEVVVVDAPPGMSRGRWSIAPRKALVAAIRAGEGDAPQGRLIVGASPARELTAGYLGFIRLIADAIGATLARTRADEEERRRTAALAELDRAKTIFFANVSHELRTPLTLLLGPTEAALATPERTLAGEELALVHRNALRLLRLVNTLLDVSRIEAGAVSVERVPTDLAGLTSDLATQFRGAIEAGGLRFETAIEPLPSPVAVDPAMWEKIVLNLLSNAFKFTFDGAVHVGLRQRGAEIELEVSDTGAGIPEEHLPRIFDRFFRVDGAQSRTHEGTGIGLSLVAELVRLHGGSIDVETRVGRGTRFVVRIPAERADAPTSTPRPGASAAYVAEAGRWTAPTDDAPVDAGPRPVILVVDDSADMRAFLRRILEPRWAVQVAATADAALSAIRERRPDLVLSDVMMPGTSGHDLVRRLREASSTATLPVILLTAHAGEQARAIGLDAGANDYVVKPFVTSELFARIETQLQLARVRLAIDREREELRVILAQAPVAIAVWRGPEHVFELANQRYLEAFDLRDVLGQRVRDVFRDTRLDLQALWAIFDEVHRTGTPFFSSEYEVPWPSKRKATRGWFFAFTLSPLRDADGIVSGLVAVAVDVTEQVQARRHVDALRLAAEDANRAKDEFLAMLGHELRNPVAPILTALRLVRLRDGQLGKEMTVIERQVQHLVRLIDDLLDVSRITRGMIELRSGFVELAEVVAQGLEVASPLLEQREHAVTLDVPARGLGLHGDAARLAQVVSNLLTNAAKYTEPRGRIVVRGRREDGVVVLSVQDTGIGIPGEVLPHVFDRFVQARQASDRASGGLGLGLAIVKSLVQMHGGTVEARSEGPGRGTEMVVRLPVAASSAVAAAPPPTREPNGEDAAAAHRILVVDDNVDAAIMLCEYLTAQGHAVAIAHDGPHALERARELQPDVALLDIGLPVMDGYELGRLLRERSTDVRLVALTGYGQAADRERSRTAGFDAHLVKPVDLEALDRVVAGLAIEA